MGQQFAVGQRVNIIGGFRTEDGFGDLYQHVGMIEEHVTPPDEFDKLPDFYFVNVNGTVVGVLPENLSPALPDAN